MLEKLKELEKGHNILVESNGKHSEMMMDIGICKLETGQEEFFYRKKQRKFIFIAFR